MTKKFFTDVQLSSNVPSLVVPARADFAAIRATGNISNGFPSFTTFHTADFATRNGYVGEAGSRINLVAEAAGYPIRLESSTSIINRVAGADQLTVSPSSVTTSVPVTLPADPTTALQAATKQYVDTKAGVAGTWTPRGVSYPAVTPAKTANVNGWTDIDLASSMWNDGSFVWTNLPGYAHQLHCQEAGRYLIIVTGCFGSAMTINCRLSLGILINGVPVPNPTSDDGMPYIANQSVLAWHSTSVVNLVPGDIVSARIYQNSGQANTVRTDSGIHIERLGGPPGPAGPPGSYEPHGFTAQMAATTLTHNVNTTVNMAAPAWNDDGWTFTATEAICPVAGRYLINCQVRISASPTTTYRLMLQLRNNGVDFAPSYIANGYMNHATTSTAVLMSPVQVSGVVNLNVGDRLSVVMLQTSGVDQTIQTIFSFFSVERIGAGPQGAPGPPGGYEPHGLTVSATGTTAVPTTTNTALALGTPTVNDGNWTISGTDAICSVAGRYLVTASVRFNIVPTTAGNHWSIIWVNGATAAPTAVSQHGIALPAAGTASPTVVSVATVNLAVGDRVQLVAWQNTNTTATPIANSSWLQIERIGAGPMGPMGPPGSIEGATMTGPFIAGGTGEITDLTVTDAPLTVGDNASYNIIFDSNEIQARSGIGTYSTLNLQPYGGKTYFGTGLSGTYTDNTLSWWFTRGPRIELYPKLDPNGAYEIGMQPSGVYHRIGHTGAAFNWYADGDFVDVADDPGVATGGVQLMSLNGIGTLDLYGTASSRFVHYGSQHVWQAGTTNGTLGLQAAGTGSINFTTNALERIRIDSAGTTLWGKTISGIANAGHEMFIRGDHYTTVDTNRPNIICNKVDVAIVASGIFQSFRHDNVQIGRIERNASTSAVLYQVSSDYRLKNDLGPVTDALDRIKMLKPHRITWKSDPTETVMTAFLAHEVQEVAPWAVSGEKDALTPEPVNDADPPAGMIEPQMMDQSQLIPLLTAAVQELTGRVEALEGA